jgi:hypothetical protein
MELHPALAADKLISLEKCVKGGCLQLVKQHKPKKFLPTIYKELYEVAARLTLSVDAMY